MRHSLILIIGLASACGGGDGPGGPCPPDYPVSRDGACFRETDGGLVAMDASTGLDGSSPMTDSGASDDGRGVASDGGVMCVGAHPNVMGMRRFCDPGACYCGDAAMGLDACYDQSVADACCPVAVVCEPAVDAGTADAAVACMGQHPNVMGMRRFCDPGWCYCGDLSMGIDVCYPAGVAAACCSVPLVCE